METSHTDVEARCLDAALKPGAIVLEAGCGRITRLVAWRDRIAELIGVDVDAAAGRENASLDRFIATDLCAPLPLADGCCDLIYSNFVIEHLRAPETAFREWHRVLRPGGSLVLLTSNVANPLVRAVQWLPQGARVRVKGAGAGAAERDVVPTVYRANTPAALKELLARAGFAAVEVHCVATLHRYVARVPLSLLRPLLVGCERVLPERRRATIVGHFRRDGD